MDRSRLIFVEGIMGSGKSTTARWLARLFSRAGIAARPVPEARPHPTNVFRTLPHWKQPWLDLTAEELMSRSYANWKAFVAKALSDPRIFVFDGQLFHGDFTSLFLMNCPAQMLHQYIRTVLQLAQPLHPTIIYCYQEDVSQALDRIGAQRGQGWVEAQVAWKVDSLYGQQHGLAGVDGWKQIYQNYRQLTDCVSRRSQFPSSRSRPARAHGLTIRRASVHSSICPSFRSRPGSAGSTRFMIILLMFANGMGNASDSLYQDFARASIA